MTVRRMFPSGVGSGLGVGEGNNPRNGVGVEAGWEVIIGVELGVCGGGWSTNGARSPEEVAKRAQPLARSASAGASKLRSPLLTSPVTRERVPKISNPETSNDAPHHLPTLGRSVNKNLSSSISGRFFDKDTAIRQNCQVTPNSLRLARQLVASPDM